MERLDMTIATTQLLFDPSLLGLMMGRFRNWISLVTEKWNFIHYRSARETVISTATVNWVWFAFFGAWEMVGKYMGALGMRRESHQGAKTSA